MKKITLLLLICLLTVGFAFAKKVEYLMEKAQPINSEYRPTRDHTGVEEILYTFEGANFLTEEWETGDMRMEGYDPADESEHWKLIDHDDLAVVPADAEYLYWWPGILELGGYISDRVLFLQTPPITLPADPAPLTFRFRQYYEGTGGTGGQGPWGTINGWDGWTVIISTDDGVTWNPIMGGTPAYNSTGMYCFSNNSQPAYPGWGGQSTNNTLFPDNQAGWLNASLPLTPYANQTVKIQFLHGADPAWDTATPPPNGDPNAYGVILTNININGTPYNFSDPTNFQGFTIGQLGGPTTAPIQWTIRDPFSFASSPTAVLTCGEETAGVWSFAEGINCFISTPWIDLPPDGDILVDFKYTGFMMPTPADHQDGDPFDGISWEVYHDLGGTYYWHNMKTPYVAITDGRHLYFSSGEDHTDATMDYFGVPDNSTYSWSITGDISQLSGKRVKFRWIALNQLNPVTPGLTFKADDFTIWFTQHLLPVTELSAEVNAQNQVVVTWTDPFMAAVDLEGIKVQRKGSADANYTTIGTVNPGVGTFTDTTPPLGTITNYQLVPIWFLGDGPGSRVLKVVAPSSNQRLLSVDNGIAAEIALPTAAGATFANKITRAVPWEKFYIKYVMVYITEQGSAASYFELYRLHEDGSGRPGSRTINTQTYIHQDTVLGWYIFEVPESANSLYETDFWVSYRTLNSSSPKVGISEVAGPTVAMWGTFTGANLSYNNYDAGNFMIRVIVEDDPLSDGDITQTPAVLSASNYPNPFNPSTTISFNLPKTGKTSLQVYNIKGQLVNTLLNEEMVAGTHNINWNGVDSHGNSVSSGIYFYKVDNAGDSIVNKMILMK